MAIWHGYIAIENLALTANQRGKLITALRKLGPASDRQPERFNHRRTRLDGQAVIFEAAFNDNNISVAGIKGYLANVFGVAASTINHSVNQTQYGPVATYERGGTNYLRLVQFGGVGSSWETSRLAAVAYLRANSAAWELAVP